MMKTVFRFTFPALISVMLFGLVCCSNDTKKSWQSLTGQAQTAEEGAESSGTSGNTVTSDDADGLEIPAPLSNGTEQILHRAGYTVSYNSATLLPNWVAWHLTADHADGKSKRSDKKFSADEDVPSPRAEDADYVRSGYDRGHMCPAGDNKWSDEAMTQSFLLTNVCPQAPSLNRGDWNEMEMACRRWAQQYGDLYIVCGPILYRGKHKTIGHNKVTVPEAFFKVILRMGDEPKAIGFIYKNEDGNRPKGDYANSVDQVERITGFDFFPALPDDVENAIEAVCNPDDWNL